MKKLSPVLFAFLLLIPWNSYGQQTVIRKFSTVNFQKEKQQPDEPSLRLQQQTEQQIKAFTKSGTTKQNRLPVVFHIVRTQGMPDITEDQIHSQIDALNRDFNQVNSMDHPNDPNNRYAARTGNPIIQFCKPANDLKGNPTSGFTANDAHLNDWKSLEDVKEIAVAWNTQHYINIWVTALENVNSGYAQMPGDNSKTDGIVIDYKYFGVGGTSEFPYDEGKTLTHLMGNYLGLYPLWGTSKCSDDYVDDTPIHNSPNYTCPEFDHVTTCDGNPTEMTMNFMDATYDACRYMFTRGQVMRMQAMLSKTGPRHLLSKTETNCTRPTSTLPATQTTKIDNKDLANQIELMPNPAIDKVCLTLDEISSDDCIYLKVLDAAGTVIKEEVLDHELSSLELNIRTWAPGIYFFNFQIDDQVVTKRLIAL